MTYPTKKLGEICNIKTGRKDANYGTDNGIYPFFTCSSKILKAPGYSFDTDAILIAGNGDVGACKEYNGKFEAYQRTYVLDNFIGIEKKLLFYYLDGYLRKILVSETLGSAIPYIKLGSLKNRNIPLPPLLTQKLIVKKLDSAFKNIDESIKITKKNIENIEELNKSVLEDILKKFENKITTIDDISEKIQYGYTGKTIEEGKYRYLRITDIQKNNIIWKNVPFVGIDDNEAKKYLLNIGDIVFARTGATVGKSCLIDERGLGNVFASYLIRIVSKKDLIFPDFLKYFFYSKYYWKQVYEDVVGAAQPNFNGTKLKNIKIPLPPLSKQKEIVAYLDKVFEKNKIIKEGYEKKLKDLEEMKQSILKEAFKGRLVKD